MTDESKAFQDHYYATTKPENAVLSGTGTGTFERDLSSMLLRQYPDLPKNVERAYRRWNLTVRDILRTETGLRLSVGENRQAVPVRVVAGLPLPFRQVITQSPDQFLWDLALHQSLLVETKTGLEYMRDRSAQVIQRFDVQSFPADNLETTLSLVERMLEEGQRFNLLKAIMSIQEDVLGAYFFREPVINLYWIPIGVIASLLKISIEALTVVVLAHELAHAYTHLGLDIDGRPWENEDFACAALPIVEGMAQFYALTVCKKLMESFPSAADAFERLLHEQSSTYWAFAEWIEEVEAQGELIRYCVIRCRSQRITGYEVFQEEVQRGRELLASGKRLEEEDNGQG